MEGNEMFHSDEEISFLSICYYGRVGELRLLGSGCTVGQGIPHCSITYLHKSISIKNRRDDRAKQITIGLGGIFANSHFTGLPFMISIRSPWDLHIHRRMWCLEKEEL
jgi:hypothetical protein